jgi:predicted nicotinamide N-methyase
MNHARLRALLDSHAPFQPAPLCPELSVFHARSLVEIWEAAERLAGGVLPAPFWAYPWAAGAAIARVLLDQAERVRGRNVLDIGAGGGITSLAAAKAEARRVVANDVDPWALTTVQLAAEAQQLTVETMLADLTTTPAVVDEFDVVLAGDLAYEQRGAGKQLGLLRRAARNGAWVLAGDAGRAWFDHTGMELIGAWRVPVARDLEGVDEREARVYRVLPDVA